MPTSDDALVDAITTGVPTLLQLLDALSSILERFQPQHLAQVLTLLETERSALRAICKQLETASFPEHVARFGQLLTLAMNQAERVMTHLEATEADPMDLIHAARDALSGELIVAGSVGTPARVRDLAEAGVDAFTIGSAAFDGS